MRAQEAQLHIDEVLAGLRNNQQQNVPDYNAISQAIETEDIAALKVMHAGGETFAYLGGWSPFEVFPIDPSEHEQPLTQACRLGKIKVVQFLLDECNIHPDGGNFVPCEPSEAEVGEFNAPIHQAVYAGHLDVVERLLQDRRLTTELKDPDGSTPLYLACEQANLPMVQLLTRYHCNVNTYCASDSGMSALELAIESYEQEIAAHLLVQGASTDFLSASSLATLAIWRQRCLFLPDNPLGEVQPRYVISMAPMNSSGDIYHIASYIFLAQSWGKVVPEVWLTYDKPMNNTAAVGTKTSTGDQVRRSLHFMNTLGIGQYFTAIMLANVGSPHASVRQNALHDHMSEQPAPLYYLDQMATTALIAKHVTRFGYEDTTRRIREGFSRINQDYMGVGELWKVARYVGVEIDKIVGSLQAENQPLMIIHVRRSDKTNSELNLPDNFINPFIAYLAGKGIASWVITADGRLNPNVIYNQGNMSTPFIGETFICDANQQQDNAKQAHLQLLLQLQEQRNVLGVVGNTSGTLDLAAFIGMQVYNIHQFPANEKVSYQQYRLYLQVCLFSIAELVRNGRNHELTASSAHLDTWLQRPKPGEGGAIISQRGDFVAAQGKQKKFGFCNLFFLKTWRVDGDLRDLRMLEEGPGKNGGYLISFNPD